MTPMVGAIRRVAATRGFDALVATLERLHRGDTRTLAVLTYHRIDDPARTPRLFPGLVSATPAAFAAQVEAVAARWTPISLHDVIAASRGRALPRRAVLLTFDDAYADFATNAWPVVRAHGVPATLFVPTGFPSDEGRSFWWDDLHRALQAAPAAVADSPAGPLDLTAPQSRVEAFRAVRTWFKATAHDEATAALGSFLASLGVSPERPPVLSWAQLRELRGEGVALAPHSVSHAMLDRLDDAAIAEEVVASKRRLADETGSDLPAFAYPSGQHDDRVVAAVRAAGVEAAFTTERGVNRRESCDWLRLARINVTHRSPSPAVRAQLLPALNAVAARLS